MQQYDERLIGNHPGKKLPHLPSQPQVPVLLIASHWRTRTQLSIPPVIAPPPSFLILLTHLLFYLLKGFLSDDKNFTQWFPLKSLIWWSGIVTIITEERFSLSLCMWNRYKESHGQDSRKRKHHTLPLNEEISKKNCFLNCILQKKGCILKKGKWKVAFNGHWRKSTLLVVKKLDLRHTSPKLLMQWEFPKSI